jgi:bis(5'-nucleosyl)-tetraphosphatase (symmetrical)
VATFAIGDIQGCALTFKKLLAEISFDPHEDTLWLVGDLVNRGPGSLEVLRLLYEMQESVITVLGNHDLHLISVALGVSKVRADDTLEDILESADRDQLIDWLRHQSLISQQGKYVLVHAGILPIWSVAKAIELSQEVEALLQGPDCVDFLEHMRGSEPHCWDDGLVGWERARVIVNAFTRMRVCESEDAMNFRFKGTLENMPDGMKPWFEFDSPRPADTTLIFGHWSALGFIKKPGLIALDTGCVWGRTITAYCIETQEVTHVPCIDPISG